MGDTWRLITIGLLGAMLLVSTAADIMIQPGYEQKESGTQIPDGSDQAPTRGASSREQDPELADEFERYKKLHRVIEEQLVHLIHEQSSQNLQQVAPEVFVMPMNFRRRIMHPLQRRLGGSRSFYLTPVGDYGLHAGGYGFGRHPRTYPELEEEPFQQLDYDATGRSQRTRSVDGGPEMDSDVAGDVQIVAAQSTLDADGVDGVIEHQVPEISTTDESTVNKVIEPRQINRGDDAIVGSPLARNHYENPHDRDQHHPSESTENSSGLIKVANAVGNIIDSVAPGLMNYENRDSASTMTSHEDPAPNYRHDSQYPLSSEIGQRAGYTSIWKAPTTRHNSHPMTGQSYNGAQHPENSEWRSIPSAQSSHAPKASNGVHYSQQAPAIYPALTNAMNNKSWLTTIHGNYPGYPSYRPDYQSYYERPPTGMYRPDVNGPSFHPSGATSSASASANNPSIENASLHHYHGFNYPSGAHSSATASASYQSGFGSAPSPYNGATSNAAASANDNPSFGNGHSPYSYGSPYAKSPTASATVNSGNYRYNYPHLSSWNNAYVAQNPHGLSNFVDQFGRALFKVIPSSFNSPSTNPANYQEYIRSFINNQIPGFYGQSAYWY